MMKQGLGSDFLWGVILSLALAGVVLWAQNEQDGRMESWRSQRLAQSIEVGAELYVENCANCHGNNGEGIGELGPSLNDEAFFEDRLEDVGWQGTLKDYVHATVTLGRVTSTRPLFAGDGNVVVMAPWGNAYGGALRQDEVDDITAFILNWEASAKGEFTPPLVNLPTMVPASSGEVVERGRALFLSTGCADCHAVRGISQADLGPDLSNVAGVAGNHLPGYTAEAYLRESILIPNAYRVESYPEEVVCGAVISRSQLEDLVTFLLSLRE